MNKLIGELVSRRLVTPEQVDDARDKQMGAKRPIRELLVEMGFVEEDDLLKISSEVFGLELEDLKEDQIDEQALNLVDYETSKRYGVLPVRKEVRQLILATSDPQDLMTLDDIRAVSGMSVKPLLCGRQRISELTEKVYGSDESVYDLFKNFMGEADVEILTKEKEKRPEAPEFRAENSPVIKLADLIFSDAVRNRASDIHVEPQEKITEIRYRVDGFLKKIMEIPAKLHPAISARLKIIAELDIAEHRKTQDGRARISVSGKYYDVRMSVLPTYHGEKIVMRLLDIKGGMIELDKLGFDKEDLKVVREKISQPQGMILVTGPTGSGKSSTLYAMLNEINTEEKNIITIEDPIEYLLEGVNQTQVDPVKDITFDKGLKSILRQDPNVLLVGEIRDEETAKTAFRAAQTGHLVMSTLHTNSAAATITRLLDIGLEPYIAASSLSLILAQRLVRTICPDCRERYEPDPEKLEMFRNYLDKYRVEEFYHGTGCEKCAYSGFFGRMALSEMIVVDDDIRSVISDDFSEEKLIKKAGQRGFRTIAGSGVKAVAEGRTTLEEVARTTGVSHRKAKEGEEGDRDEREEKAGEKARGQRDRPLVMVADDERDIRKVLEKRLTLAGYNVLLAENGKAAVDIAARENPDLIVMDIMMPELNGIDATRALRSRLDTASIPVVMLTAKKDKESELSGIDAGADDYITKPYDKEKLLARIKMLLRRARR